MPLHIQRGLALIGVGLLLGFVGLIWVANLFGVADEHAKQISESRVNHLVAGETETAGLKGGIGVGRFLAGGGFMVVGLVFIVTGVVYMTTPPSE